MTIETNQPHESPCEDRCGCHHIGQSIHTRIEAIEKNMSTMSVSVAEMSASVARLTNAMVGDELMGSPGYGKRLSIVEQEMVSQKTFKTKVIAWTGAISATISAAVAFLAKVLTPFLGSGKG